MMDNSLESFIHKLRLEQFNSELEKGEEILSVIEHAVATSDWKNAGELISVLLNIQAVLQTKMPWETTSYNMVQRVIKVVKDEYNTCIREEDGGQLNQKLFHEFLLNEEQPDMSMEFSTLKENVIKVILELKAELEQCLELIAIQGEKKIHSDEVILTCGFCPTVFAFLKRAAKKRRFNVIVGHSSPNYDGTKMSRLLCAENIPTTLIRETTMYSLMSRVNKVIIGTQTVLKNGGIKTFVGANLLATMAKFHSVPVHVCCPTYMFSNLTSEETNQHRSPDSIIVGHVPKEVLVTIAKLDYIPPELITNFITNNEGFAPSSVYRLLTELYDPITNHV